MKYKIRISLGITAIAVVFALGFIVSNQQTFGANICGSGLGCGFEPPNMVVMAVVTSVILHHSLILSVTRLLVMASTTSTAASASIISGAFITSANVLFC